MPESAAAVRVTERTARRLVMLDVGVREHAVTFEAATQAPGRPVKRSSWLIGSFRRWTSTISAAPHPGQPYSRSA